ncbi:YdcH family protein [Nitrosophilus alvini]|uniref:YdcH family protein n=1 Tax=Nitrosophilus alvini TaxID=2714855 RepID=UPI00190D29F1|nr:DUF465 domain-containing protein [Nitrosophilus alvini]
MLEEYKDIVEKLMAENPHFAAVVEKHDELDKLITEVEEGREHMEDLELEKLKKEKLRLKDEAYAMILEYKKKMTQ